MDKRLVIFDMDGTCTVEDPGAREAFADAHATGLAQMLGCSPELIRQRYGEVRKEMGLYPDSYAWQHAGLYVAPALVDGFVDVQVRAQRTLASLGENVVAWDEKLGQLYQENYLKLTTSFRPDLLPTLDALRNRGVEVYIVSNSDPKKIAVRLEALGGKGRWIKERVKGFARKFLVTNDIATLPESIIDLHPKRPVWVHRGHYHRVLVELLKEHNVTWSQLVVVGDILELDGLVAVLEDAQMALIRGEHTPQYEINWLNADPRRGRVIDSLTEVLDEF